jgi:hypothetical protein
MKKKLAAAVVAGIAATALSATPAYASWSQLTDGRVGFWTQSYGTGAFGAYRTPDDGGRWGYVLPNWLDDPRSIWNDSRRTIYVYKNPTCTSAGGRWYRAVSPGQRVEMITGTDWRQIQAFSFLQPNGRPTC